MDEEPKCAVCQEPSPKRCLGCKKVYYCGAKHQKQDWPKHKKVCCPYKMSTNDKVGRYLYASRPVEAGESILTEDPLVVGPKQFTVPVCLGCYAPVSGSYSCSKCGWPLCSSVCEQSLDHAPECHFVTTYRKEKIHVENFSIVHPLYQCVIILRCLYLKESAPQKWKELMSLQTHSNERKYTDIYTYERNHVAFVIRNTFKLETSEEEILNLCGILYVNGQEVPVRGTNILGVYMKSSLLEHCCIPNCTKYFDDNKQLVISAAVEIEKDDHFTISYVDHLWGTQSRQTQLRESKFFTCTCKRCADPTELGTYMSAVKCPKHSDHYLLPTDPFKIPETSWKCKECEEPFPPNYMMEVRDKIGQELASLEQDNVADLEKFIDKHSKFLHPNHYYLIDAKVALTHLLTNYEIFESWKESDPDEIQNKIPEPPSPAVTIGKLQKKIDLLLEILKLTDILLPGYTRPRAMFNYDIYIAYLYMARYKKEINILTDSEFRDYLMKARKHLSDALDIFLKDPFGNQEGQLTETAQNGIKDLDFLIQKIQAPEDIRFCKLLRDNKPYLISPHLYVKQEKKKKRRRHRRK